MTHSDKTKILFLCTGNSCRSQMAEGFANALKPDTLEAYSAGTEPKGIDPLTIKVMLEAGVDITGQRSKNVSEFSGIEFDYVVTLCGHAHESCPFFPGKTKIVHVGFEDPHILAKNADSEDEKLIIYRRIRDEIRAFVEKIPGSLKQGAVESDNPFANLKIDPDIK